MTAVLKMLENINATCEVSRRAFHALHRFRVSFIEKFLVFNRSICLDLISICGETVFHVVEKDAKTRAAKVVDQASESAIWEEFIHIWMSKYIGLSDIIAVDQRLQLHSHEWK